MRRVPFLDKFDPVVVSWNMLVKACENVCAYAKMTASANQPPIVLHL